MGHQSRHPLHTFITRDNLNVLENGEKTENTEEGPMNHKANMQYGFPYIVSYARRKKWAGKPSSLSPQLLRFHYEAAERTFC